MQLNLKWRTLSAFIAPSIPISALGLPLVVYLPPFYAEEMGLGLGIVGTIFMITRFWDVFTDPVLGVLSDRVQTKLGRRRHWIIISVPILLISVYQIFMPQSEITANYLLWWMVILYVGYTLLSVSHMSWGAELSSDYHERARVQGWREFALMFGMLAVLLLPALIEHLSKITAAIKVASMGWFVIILLPITVAIAVWQVPEYPTPKATQISWRKTIKILIKNRLLQKVLLADLLTGLVPGITGSLYLFFVNYVMDLEPWSSLLLLAYFVAGFLAIPVWIHLSYRLGKHQTFSLAMIYTSIILPIILLVKPGIFWQYGICNLLYGLSSGASGFLLRSIMADVTDYDNLETGSQRTGLYYSFLTMTNKIGYALAVGITYPLLDWIGFIPGSDNTTAAITGLKYIFIFLPIPITIFAALIMWNFPLNKDKHRELRRLIDERDSQITIS